MPYREMTSPSDDINNEKRSGLNNESCGTPTSPIAVDDCATPVLTKLGRYDVIQLRAEPPIPKVWCSL